MKNLIKAVTKFNGAADSTDKGALLSALLSDGMANDLDSSLSNGEPEHRW